MMNVSLSNATTIYFPNNSGNGSDLNLNNDIDLYPFEVVLPFTIIYVIIFITGLIGNIGTCIVITKNKSMQTATNYYLFSLAISDLLLLISALPFEIYRIWAEDNYIFGQGFCTTQGLAAETSANATVLTITAFTVERYVAICHPFKAHAWSKPSRAVRYIIGIWIIALGLAIPQAIQFEVVREYINGQYISHCNIKNAFFDHSFEISTFIIFIVPMSLITVLYVLIGVQLKKSNNIGPSRTTSDGKQEEFGRKSASRNTAAQKRVVKMLSKYIVIFNNFLCSINI